LLAQQRPRGSLTKRGIRLGPKRRELLAAMLRLRPQYFFRGVFHADYVTAALTDDDEDAGLVLADREWGVRIHLFQLAGS
jgi:hypothetical protein